VRTFCLSGSIIRDQYLLSGWFPDGTDRRSQTWPVHSQVWLFEKSSCFQPFCKIKRAAFDDIISVPGLQCYNLKRILFLPSFSYSNHSEVPIKTTESNCKRPMVYPNAMIHSDLGIPTVQDVIHKRSNKHRTKVQSHPNPLLQSLSRDNIARRLKLNGQLTCNQE